MIHTAENVITQYLDTGESLLWSGKPRGGIRLRAEDALLIPFSLVWGGFAIFWEYSVLTLNNHATNFHAQGPGAVFPLFGIPFVLVGLYLIIGRFFADAWIRGHTYYGVTSERVLIISGMFSQHAKSIALRNLSETSISLKGDGSGTITFGSTVFLGRFSGGVSWPGGRRYAPPAFEMIWDAKDVYDIIRNAQKSAS